MTGKNVAVSVRQKLLNHARSQGDDYQRILTRFAIERLLYRLCQTGARENYVLKGAMLLVTWPDHAGRPTGDLDLLGRGDPGPDALRALFEEICAVELAEDGIVFDPASIRVEPVREEDRYQGARLTLTADLAGARIAVQVDIGFGDHVYPAPRRRGFPGLLPNLPAADILMYPSETVVAEKFEAMLRFGETMTRLKDYYDIWLTTRTFGFDRGTLVEAISGTLNRRETAAPTEIPFVLSQGFADLPEKQAIWAAFLRRNPPALPPPPLAEVLRDLRSFFGPVIDGLQTREAAHGAWSVARSAWEGV